MALVVLVAVAARNFRQHFLLLVSIFGSPGKDSRNFWFDCMGYESMAMACMGMGMGTSYVDHDENLSNDWFACTLSFQCAASTLFHNTCGRGVSKNLPSISYTVSSN